MQTASVRLSYARVLFMIGVLSACSSDAPDAREAQQAARASLEAQRAIVASDDFESGGFSALPWSVRGDARIAAEAAKSGEFGARLGGIAAITARISTRARRDLQVAYDVQAVGLDRREYLSVEYSLNGLLFLPLARERNDEWSRETVRLPAFVHDRTGVYLRFTVRALEGRRDQGFEGVYLDNVVVSAAGAAPPDAGPPDAGAGCVRDEDCAAESGVCSIGSCDVATGACTSVPRAEGTPCGDGQRCDAQARCLVCGDASSTYQLLQSTIFDSPVHGCTTGGVCHGTSPGAARLNLTSGASYTQLVNVASTLSTLLRVAPGSPDDSFLYRKLAWGTNGTPVMGGGPMPAGGKPPVPARMLDGLGAWISDGAPAEGFVRGTLENLCQAPCSSDADCSDANACNGVEQCVAGSCSAGAILRCDDGRACTSDRCDPASGCLHVPSPGLACGDGGACDAAGLCQCETGSSDPSCQPPTEQPTGQLTLRWDFATPKGVSSTPLVVGDVVYATSWDGIVYALDRATGAERWRHNTNSRAIQGGVSRAPDGSLLVGDGEAMVWKLAPSGAVLWSRSLQNTGADHIWNSLTIHDGLVYVPISSHSDVPCTKGRTVALDLNSGATVWQRLNVPAAGVCRTDTAITCTTSNDCPGGGTCESAVGGAVTARVLVDPSGSALYVATVGCYTFPQVGDTDALMRLDAKTGETHWVQRFSASEQFGYCVANGADCRTASDCPSGACAPKAAFHDFGFINGPYLLDARDAAGNPRRLLVAASKSGTLYAVDPVDGSRIWTRAVLPPPVSPSFAGYGLFNGALAYASGKLFAALYEFVPPTSPAPKHLMAFSEVDGSTVWSDEIGRSWSSLTVDRGILYTGTQVASELYSYLAESGARLGTFPLPATTASAPRIDGDELFVGYGLSGAGGVRSYRVH